jgi:hypothetical protein
MISKKSAVRRDLLFGSCCFINYLFSRALFFGGLVFFLVGFLSQKSITFYNVRSNIQFFPQGLVICFYGSVRTRFGLYLILSRFWIVGKGFNEYDRREKRVCIFRWGFPGKDRCFEFSCSFSDVEFLCLESQNSMVNPSLYLVLKEKRKILLTQLGSTEFRSFQEVEYFSANLARFLKVQLKNKVVMLFLHIQ